jgi:GDP-4-dehydro-6-deoxy-D-mannose reductase
MRVLITGVCGFVGRHLAASWSETDVELVGLGRTAPDDALRARLHDFVLADLGDAEMTLRAVRAARPDQVFHLAAQASVEASWRSPGETLAGNVASSVNLLEAIKREAPDARVLVSCSGEEYGPVAVEHLPVVESEPLRPQNPYAVSKAAVDLLAGFYADAHGLAVVRARAFNHCGPGQSDAYVVGALASQIAAAEAEAEAEAAGGVADLSTGNLRPRRDFTDVRDIVRAYRLALQLAPPGEYNVCSGRSISIADILATLTRQARVEVEVHTDPERQRKHEVMDVRGSHQKLTDATRWEPMIPLERTLADTLDWWRTKLAVGAGR